MRKNLPELRRVMSFIEGALNIDMSLSCAAPASVKEANEEPVTIFFLSSTASKGWFTDFLDFDSIEAAIKFFSDVELTIKISRLEQREPYEEMDMI
ncbi:MAG: hypothetical protein ABSA46_17430 [Thermodesulfovibrionales bacterium]|jgi:hypothetical protein